MESRSNLVTLGELLVDRDVFLNETAEPFAEVSLDTNLVYLFNVDGEGIIERCGLCVGCLMVVASSTDFLRLIELV